jgi:haloalkane dehalogenase
VVDARQPEELLDVARPADDREALIPRARVHLRHEHGGQAGRVHEAKTAEIDDEGVAPLGLGLGEGVVEAGDGRDVELAREQNAVRAVAVLDRYVESLLRWLGQSRAISHPISYLCHDANAPGDRISEATSGDLPDHPIFLTADVGANRSTLAVSVDVFRTPDERFEGLPGYDFEPHYVEVEGLRMHYLDEGEGDPVVCFHGEPTWSYLYRKMIPELVESGHRVIAPDYAGFGRSDKPTERRWYTYDRHVEAVTRLLEQVDVRAATVVVQDWGGPIGLRWATENPDRAERLVILNTGLFAGQVNEAFMAWRDFAERNPDMPVGFVIQSATVTDLPQEILDAYEAPWPNAESKAGVAQFPLLVPLNPSDPGVAEMDAVREQLASWERPALVCFSDSDPIFTPKAGQRFVDLIPGADDLCVIEGAAHFLQEDKGEKIGREINSFLEKAVRA